MKTTTKVLVGMLVGIVICAAMGCEPTTVVASQPAGKEVSGRVNMTWPDGTSVPLDGIPNGLDPTAWWWDPKLDDGCVVQLKVRAHVVRTGSTIQFVVEPGAVDGGKLIMGLDRTVSD